MSVCLIEGESAMQRISAIEIFSAALTTFLLGVLLCILLAHPLLQIGDVPQITANTPTVLPEPTVESTPEADLR
jgi:hypothetical protein